MDVASLAMALMSAQTGNTQAVLAADMTRMNAQAQNSIAKVLDEGVRNLANLSPGFGGNLDIRV